MDPRAAAEFATGAGEMGDSGAEGSPMDGQIDMGGSEPGTDSGGSPWFIEGLKNTEPNTPISQLEGLDDIRDHWKRYGLRGLEKWANVDDAWAGVDLAKFAIGAVLSATSDDDGGSSGSAGDTSSSGGGGDGDGDSVNVSGLPTVGDA
ncbi:hypothetical protein C489_05213 [Natrinema versiforme JCM 10478]|uniref:Uncharacterized protein n=2 Tax=Natrinema versiforme TaxID=88724 RepID=L9Y6P6_9EURY|nr:hypothetical protein C489_05213 [Natrinema versiforme JCM 10478]